MGRDSGIGQTTPVRAEVRDGTGRLRLSGEVDHTSVEQLDQAVADLLGEGVHELVVDFGELSFFDSACISALVRARAHAEERGIGMTLVDVDRYARRILDLTGLSSAFDIVPKQNEDEIEP